ncbi:MAG: 1-deoxy-D-xylulose-5-phosphate synthase, partial [Lentisphaerae bacterium]|nr:1-deoxy-D-xylulose-5-phosphate synthase [Lentisphaerota bacterium]
KINIPADLIDLEPDILPQLADEIRELIIDTVGKTGGHLAPNLGTVELTIALLSVFEPPTDKVVWDVSHQTYTWKILTGRRDAFPTLRQTDGISGYLSRAESEYDVFGAGHAGTALSAALGMAAARDARCGNEHVIAVVGDAALGCGSSFGALNNIMGTTKRLILILNDNEMSISEPVGAVSKYLGKLLAHPSYNRFKRSLEDFARNKLKLGGFKRYYYKIEGTLKSLFVKSVLFEEFGLRYIGPIDGHDIKTLTQAMQIAKASAKPVMLHIDTQKGKGYIPAQDNPERWHGTSPFNPESGVCFTNGGTKSYSNAFGDALISLAERDKRLVAISAAMRSGTGLTNFSEKYKGRFYDVGISEEHAVIFAACMATNGLIPVVAVYSTFSQRSVDYIIHDVCLQNLPVIFCLDRAGIVGDDGPTHHGVFDISLFRSIPNLVMMQPADESELVAMLEYAVNLERPVMIRYPRQCVPEKNFTGSDKPLELGKATIIRKGEDIQIWALG